MRRSTRILTLTAVVVFVATGSLRATPGPDVHLGTAKLMAETAPLPAPGDVIALAVSGRIATKPVDRTTDSWTGDLVSLATGEVVGTLRHEISCQDVTSFPCVVFTSTDTFDLPGGRIVSEGTESVAPYAGAEPGIFHVGIHPEGNSIVSATGVYEGRTGQAQLKAVHDGREYPEYVTFNDVWLIHLNPAG